MKYKLNLFVKILEYFSKQRKLYKCLTNSVFGLVVGFCICLCTQFWNFLGNGFIFSLDNCFSINLRLLFDLVFCFHHLRHQIGLMEILDKLVVDFIEELFLVLVPGISLLKRSYRLSNGALIHIFILHILNVSWCLPFCFKLNGLSLCHWHGSNAEKWEFH